METGLYCLYFDFDLIGVTFLDFERWDLFVFDLDWVFAEGIYFDGNLTFL